jgi:hypothetical protein
MARDMQSSGQASGAGSGRQAMPAGLRRALAAAIALLLAGALYLIAVRGEALLADLSALSQRAFCF